MNAPTEQALNWFGAAAHRVLRLEEELAHARTQRDAALTWIHESGVRKCHVAGLARAYLLEHGFDVGQIERLAISPASVRLVLDGRRSPTACTSSTPARPSA